MFTASLTKLLGVFHSYFFTPNLGEESTTTLTTEFINRPTADFTADFWKG